jgi:hypothetical protein
MPNSSTVGAIACHLLARQHHDVIAYGAGWTDRERQQPVGDGGRSEPRQADAIAAELERALADPDPLHGIAQLLAGWAAAFVLDPDGVTKTTTSRSPRTTRPQPPRRPEIAASRSDEREAATWCPPFFAAGDCPARPIGRTPVPAAVEKC